MRLTYRYLEQERLFVYGTGVATAKPDLIITGHSNGIFSVEGGRILVRAGVDVNKSLEQPPSVWLSYLDGKAAVAGIPLILGGGEIEVEQLNLFFKLAR